MIIYVCALAVGNQTAVEYKTEESGTQLLEENMCETLPTLIESTNQETSCIIENELKIPSFRKAEGNFHL